MRWFQILPALVMGAPVLALMGGAAQAEDTALILGSDDYQSLGDLRGGTQVLDAANDFRDLGFSTRALRNAGAEPARDALDRFTGDSDGSERVVVALSGRFVTDGDRSWYMLSDSEDPSLFGLENDAVSLESILRVLGDQQGRAVLLLGADPEANEELGAYLSEGVSGLDVPQGVTVFRGAPSRIGGFLEDEVARPGADLMAAARDAGGISVEGYAPSNLTFVPEGYAPAPRASYDSEAEAQLWGAADGADTLDGYQDYLANYPQGPHADEAQARIEAILDEPNRQARLNEEALDLSEEARQEIQRDLTLLDYDTRGIDGIFGPGTRGGISAWQAANDVEETSYLTREQIDRLDAQAARRQAQLEAEAEERRQAQARRDQTFWEETGAQGDEAGYRAYLEKFPDGQHAETARQNLDAIEEEKRGVAQAEERRAWDNARQANGIPAYRNYLDKYPKGTFVEEAKTRIAALRQQRQEEQQNAQARQAEQQLGLNPVTAQLVEAKLSDLGLEPGKVDGTFDDATRRALRRYQGARDLPSTGYLNEATVVRLLADSVGQVLQ